jgi:alcohol dehydrogenase, propanol-preferring
LSDIPALNYDRDLFQERRLLSVTSNTRDDGRELLAFAESHHLRVQTDPYPMSRAGEALAALASGRVNGAAVLLP